MSPPRVSSTAGGSTSAETSLAAVTNEVGNRPGRARAPGNAERPGVGTRDASAELTAAATDTLHRLALSSAYQRRWGFEDALAAMAQANQAVAAAGAPFLRNHPRYAELVAQRQHVVTTRCAAPGCRDRCSRCARARAVESNRRRYSSDDYPGVEAAMAVHSAGTR